MRKLRPTLLAAALLSAGAAGAQVPPSQATAPVDVAVPAQPAAPAAQAPAPAPQPAAVPAPAAAPGALPAAEAQPKAGAAEPARLDRPSDAALASKVEAEPRQAFWGQEPGRPGEETDSYTLPVVPIRLSGYFWVDNGYMTQANTQAGTYDKDIEYSQGRFVLGASYRRDFGPVFGEARVQLVGFDSEYTKSLYEPHTQDAFVRFGGKLWDVQFGRFLAWEPYYRGNGIELYTAEESGALGGPSMYRVDYALGYEDEPGQAAVHLYPADWAAVEVGSVYGVQSYQNKVGVRPVVALRRAGVLLVAGAEYVDWSPQDVSNKVGQTAKGVGGRVQYTALGTTLGVDAARANVDATAIDGTVDAVKTFDKTTVGAFLESDFWKNVIGAGYHQTIADNAKGERNKHHQAFVSYQYRLPVDGLSVKAVLGYARAQLEDVDARAKFENDMTSFRLRIRYDFR